MKERVERWKFWHGDTTSDRTKKNLKKLQKNKAHFIMKIQNENCHHDREGHHHHDACKVSSCKKGRKKVAFWESTLRNWMHENRLDKEARKNFPFYEMYTQTCVNIWTDRKSSPYQHEDLCVSKWRLGNRVAGHSSGDLFSHPIQTYDENANVCKAMEMDMEPIADLWWEIDWVVSDGLHGI